MNKLIKKQKKNNKGFSLVELIVVIAIMAVLIGVIAPQFLGYTDKAKKSTDVQNAQQVAQEIAISIAEADSTDNVDTEAVATSGVTYPVQTVPDVKYAPADVTGLVFYYAVTGGEVTVSVGNGTNSYTLYPTVDDAWAQ